MHGDYAPGPGVIRLESAIPGLFDLPNVLDPLLPNLDTYICPILGVNSVALYECGEGPLLLLSCAKLRAGLILQAPLLLNLLKKCYPVFCMPILFITY